MNIKERKHLDFEKRLNQILNHGDENGIFEIGGKETAYSEKYHIKLKKEDTVKALLERYNLDEDYRILILEVFESVKELVFLPTDIENTIQIMYCIEGQADIISENNEKYTLNKGNILIYRENNSKKYKYKFKSKKFKKMMFVFNIDKLEYSFLSSISNKVLYNWKEKILKIFEEDALIHIEPNSKIKIMLNQFRNIDINNVSEYISFKTKVVEFIAYILDSKMITSKKIIIDERGIIDDVKEIINEHSVSDIPNIKKISEITGLSNYQLQSIFKQIEGVTIFQYIQKIKMNYAKTLLETEAEKNILDIANEIGYDSPSKFSLAFRKFFGILPSKYKKNNKKK